MAKRQTAGGDSSLILRSAESLGRMIGALQRQLDTVADQARPASGTKKRATTKRAATNHKATGPKKNRKATKRAKTKRAPKR